MERPLSSFPQDVLRVLTCLAGSLTTVHIAGSAASDRLYWPCDVDGVCRVKVPTAAAAASFLQERIAQCLKTPMLWLADIKCGSDASDSSGAARWTPKDVLSGSVKLSKGALDLGTACAQPALCKVDAVAFIPATGRFTEISMIYMFLGFPETHGLAGPSFEQGLKSDILALEKEGNWLKVCKRMRSLAVILHRDIDADALLAILNSPAGQAGQIDGDLLCLETLFAYAEWPIPLEKVEAELDLVKYRAAGVFGLSAKAESMVALLCNEAQRVPSNRTGIAPLRRIVQKLEPILSLYASTSAHKQLEAAGILRLAWFRP